MTAVTVSIADVRSKAVRVAAGSVKPGDLVFDPMGRTYPVRSVRWLKDSVRIIREDGVWSYIWHPADWNGSDGTITIIRKADA